MNGPGARPTAHTWKGLNQSAFDATDDAHERNSKHPTHYKSILSLILISLFFSLPARESFERDRTSKQASKLLLITTVFSCLFLYLQVKLHFRGTTLLDLPLSLTTAVLYFRFFAWL